jgi:hypothetical protein
MDLEHFDLILYFLYFVVMIDFDSSNNDMFKYIIK